MRDAPDFLTESRDRSATGEHTARFTDQQRRALKGGANGAAANGGRRQSQPNGTETRRGIHESQSLPKFLVVA
jgi:hypothetical protein